jgi:hypothetical protein
LSRALRNTSISVALQTRDRSGLGGKYDPGSAARHFVLRLVREKHRGRGPPARAIRAVLVFIQESEFVLAKMRNARAARYSRNAWRAGRKNARRIENTMAKQ